MLIKLLILLLVAVGLNFLMFLIAFRRQTDKLTDISYALTFILLAGLTVWLYSADVAAAHIVAVVMVCLWAVRLGGFLLYRISKTGQDHRFDEMRGNFKKFLQFWLLQGVSVWVILIPVLLLLMSPNATVSVMSLLGIFIWAVGLLTEATADIQKFRFSQNPKNKNKWIDEGVWKYSRHPNYFGEICVWVGMYIFAAANLSIAQTIPALISPLFITSLLIFVSGIPKLEKSADERWGKDKKYQEYKRRTSILVPSPKAPAKH
jgi:steroid 5-alpha reductase family enzyme